MLTIAARVESTIISKTPFQFPLTNLYQKMDVNSSFYTYQLNSAKGTLKLGSMQKSTSARKPFYQEFVTPESGHPPGFIYGWVMNDDKNLYVVQEFTPDNTMDGDKDYAKVYVKTGQGLREFKVSVPETKWGKSSFIYTNKVAYQHKFYEFVIPLKELGLKPGAANHNLSIAFAGYGTMSAGNYQPAVAYDPENKLYLVVYQKYAYAPASEFQIYGQFIQENGTPGEPFPISNSSGYKDTPAVAYDSYQHRFLVVWPEYSNETYHLYGHIVDGYGPLATADFVVTDSSSNAQMPTVAYDDINRQYLVAWTAYPNSYSHIYGQFLDENGTFIGGRLPISDDADGTSQTSPTMVYDRESLQKPTGLVTVSDMTYLTSLEASNSEITNLSGLEKAINLQQLWLNNNGIHDLAPLSGLTKLQQLYLRDNQISNLEALKDLTNLKGLYLGGNQISDISFLTG